MFVKVVADGIVIGRRPSSLSQHYEYAESYIPVAQHPIAASLVPIVLVLPTWTVAFSTMMTMIQADLLSISQSSNLHVAYLTDVRGLDDNTAMLLYRAERLQENGQYKLALQYFKKVLEVKPNCVEARDSALMTAELLADDEQKKNKVSLKTINEKAIISTSYTTIEMEVHWSDHERAIHDYYPDPERAAFRAARSQLANIGHENSPMKMLKNEIGEDRLDASTEWQTFMSGKALFQVTLVPDKNDKRRVLINHEDTAMSRQLHELLSFFASEKKKPSMLQPLIKEEENKLPQQATQDTKTSSTSANDSNSISDKEQEVRADDTPTLPSNRFDDASEARGLDDEVVLKM